MRFPPIPAERGQDRLAVPLAAHPAGQRALTLGHVATALLALIAFANVFARGLDFDYWWHLAAGRAMVNSHRLPTPDPFSFSAAGRSWIAHEWLAEVAMFRLHMAFGPGGTLALFGAGAAVMVVAAVGISRRAGLGQLPAICWSAVAFAAISPFLGARPQVAAFMLMACVLWVIERWAVRQDRSIWALPALFWLWGNVHGSFAVGLAAPALILAGDTAAAALHWAPATRLSGAGRRRLGAALALSVVAIAVNPNGPRLLLYPLTKMYNPMLAYLGEWKPLDLGDPHFWPFALLAVGYFALLTVRRPCAPASDLLLIAAFVLGSAWGRRFVPFASLCLLAPLARAALLPGAADLPAPAILTALGRWRADWARRLARPTRGQQVMNAATLLVVIALFLPGMRPRDPDMDPRLPVAAVATLGAEGLQGPLFNAYDWGGYLIWRLGPDVRVFIDGRGDDLYMQGGELKRYFDTAYLRAGGDDTLDAYGIRTVLFQKDTQLTRHLQATAGWQTVYDDGLAVVLRRSP